MKNSTFILVAFLTAGCMQLSLGPSDFAWPIETVLSVNEDGFIQEDRYSFSTNVKSLFFAETQDSSSYLNAEVRIIRDNKGYYYFIANEFKNVYLFNAVNGELVWINQFFVSEFGVDLPAFNQRKPFIELLDGEQHVLYLNSEGIKGEEK